MIHKKNDFSILNLLTLNETKAHFPAQKPMANIQKQAGLSQ